MRNAILAERRAEAAALSSRIASHRHGDAKCRPACDELKGMKAELKKISADIRAWFDSPKDSATLF
jgi:hypothetical protein